MDNLNELIKNFCEKYNLEFYDNFKLKVINDISKYIQGDDFEYYHDRQNIIDKAFGMLYEDSNKRWVILIKEQDLINLFATLIHEYVHLCDYKMLSKVKTVLTLRELQNDDVFLFWTEFHAAYLSYRFLIDMDSTKIDVKNAQNEIVVKLKEYYSSNLKLEKNELIDKAVRSYGSYLALYDRFCDEVILYPEQYYYNKTFLEIYNFLICHKTFDDFIADYNDFHRLLLEA